MISSRSTALLVGSAAVLVAGSIALLSQKSSGADKNNQDVEDFISEDDVVGIFDNLFLHMQQVLAQISQQIQQIQVISPILFFFLHWLEQKFVF